MHIIILLRGKVINGYIKINHYSPSKSINDILTFPIRASHLLLKVIAKHWTKFESDEVWFSSRPSHGGKETDPMTCMTYCCAWRPEAKWPFHHSLPELLGKGLTETDAQPIWLHWCPEIHRNGSASGSRGLELETCITAPGFTCGSHRSKHGSSSFPSLLFISQAIYLAAGSYVA